MRLRDEGLVRFGLWFRVFWGFTFRLVRFRVFRV